MASHDDTAAKYMAMAEDELHSAYTAEWTDGQAWPLYHVGRAQVYATLAHTAATRALAEPPVAAHQTDPPGGGGS